MIGFITGAFIGTIFGMGLMCLLIASVDGE